MVIEFKDMIDIFQTGAIIVALIVTISQWRKTRKTVTIDNYSKIISTMNNLRNFRIQFPSLERALFKTREGWGNNEIRKRVYAVELANIFEWVLLSHENSLIGKEEWNDWASMWKRVILADESMRTLMEDKTIYTFRRDAQQFMKEWIKEAKTQKKMKE